MKHHRILLAALLPATTAILCPAGSQCAANCGNVLAATSPDDLVCDERAFKIDPTGQLFAGQRPLCVIILRMGRCAGAKPTSGRLSVYYK
ncbi:hypothetical protein E4U54_007145, partial [Claviceps lovelessii]